MEKETQKIRINTPMMIGLFGAVFSLPGPYSAESIRSSAGVSYLGTNEKARRELDYAPRILDQGLPTTLEYEHVAMGSSGVTQLLLREETTSFLISPNAPMRRRMHPFLGPLPEETMTVEESKKNDEGTPIRERGNHGRYWNSSLMIVAPRL